MAARILVVDDDPVTCELICEILHSAGMDASSMTDSSAAAARLRNEKFHAVFMDMRMPGMDGIELAKQIRASSVNKSTVLVMITGEEDRTLMKRAFEAGVELFLFKPVERTKLLTLIRAAGGQIERERRRFTRVRLSCKISIESGQERIDGTTMDLSLGGALVRGSPVFAADSVVSVHVELEAGTTPLRALARVVRVIGTDCMGVEFKNLGVQEGKRLQEFLLPLILGTS